MKKSAIPIPEIADDAYMPEESELSNLPVIPSIVFQGIPRRFVEALGDSTEAPPEFLIAAFLTTVAALIGRRAWITYSRPTFANLFTLLVGETATSRKTTAVGFALDLMIEVAAQTKSKLKPLYGLASVEGLADAMMQDKDSDEPFRIIAIEDEFKSLMRKAQQKGVSNLVPRLTELYNCGRRFEVNTRNNRVTIENPFLCLLSGSTCAWFSESMSDSEISGGWFNRWSMFGSKAIRLIPFPVAPDSATWRGLVRDLAEVVQDVDGEYKLTAEARDLFTQFYMLFRERSDVGLRAEATARADLHAIKYSLLYAALEHHKQIHAEDMARGIALANYNLDVALSVVGDAGLSWMGAREKKLMDLLRASGGRMSTRDIMRILHLCADDINRMAPALNRVGLIEITTALTPAGHRRVFLEAI